jgi:hypothetical protein
MADDSEREDPVLVRPYITTQPGGQHDRPAQTWPATADLPEDGTREMPRIPAPATAPGAAAKSTTLRRRRLLVLAAIGVPAVLGGAGLFLLQPSDEDTPPPTARPASSAPAPTGSAGAAPVASAATLSAAPATRGAGRTTPTAAATSRAPGAPGQATSTAPAAGPPSATLSPPPGTARTGPITAAGGRCLHLGGLFAGTGAPVQMSGCSGVSYQRWTLASDGTLRVVDRCAAVQADATVRIGDCDDGPATQWRAGPRGSLVNPETGRCLTDPGTLGTTVTVSDCTGAESQRWTLP